jgi:hypothetical protein
MNSRGWGRQDSPPNQPFTKPFTAAKLRTLGFFLTGITAEPAGFQFFTAPMTALFIDSLLGAKHRAILT